MVDEGRGGEQRAKGKKTGFFWPVRLGCRRVEGKVCWLPETRLGPWIVTELEA
jgi:hypothetical protein